MPGRKTNQGRHRAKPDPVAKLVGAKIRHLRKEQDFSFDAFVEETGLGRGYVSELERGMVVPTIHTLLKVARALQVSAADLVLGSTVREQLFDLARNLPPSELARLLEEVRRLVR